MKGGHNFWHFFPVPSSYS